VAFQTKLGMSPPRVKEKLKKIRELVKKNAMDSFLSSHQLFVNVDFWREVAAAQEG
jgi:hypothetical protein